MEKMLHHVIVEHAGPVVEGSAESVHADVRHVKLCGFLRKPVDRYSHQRVPHDAEVLCQRKGHARPAARDEGQEIDPVHVLEHGVDPRRDVDLLFDVSLHGRLRWSGRRTWVR